MADFVGNLMGCRVVAFADGSYCNGIEAYAFSIYIDRGIKPSRHL
ncbi:MAG TPA: hypothetical protein PKI14_00660 [Fervidobacterium sp.]|nr:hypothetical protein [Fervidobacterium sp.]HQE47847.1 hypothetical protein [Fervidobacterium sp.]HUM41441.1 hypothetical protein [Fervidobacterium sp.]